MGPWGTQSAALLCREGTCTGPARLGEVLSYKVRIGSLKNTLPPKSSPFLITPERHKP